MLDDYPLKISFLGGFLILVPFFVRWYIGLRGDQELDVIPTIGFSDPILSYLSAFRFYLDTIPMIKEGYDKTRPGLFKVANFRRWMVVASGSDLIDDVRRAPEDVLSLRERFKESFQSEYTIDLLNSKDAYFIDLLRSKFARDFAGTLKDAHEELIMAIEDLIPACEHEWVKVPILQTTQHLICRTTNRVLVGVPLCRDHDYQNLNLSFLANVVISGTVISWFPKFLKPIVSRVVFNLPSKVQQEIEFIKPMVEERFTMIDEYGEDWDDKPNDFLMWLMIGAKGVERSIEALARRMLLANFAGIHSTAVTSTQVLYRLLANPEYLEPLREEADAVMREEGWTKTGMDKMYKMDSFIRETQRLDGLVVLPLHRLVMRPFTFSNGVTLPPGTMVSVPASATHTDERIYSNPNEFDGFRFEKLRKNEEETTTSRYQSVSVSCEYLAFGVGKSACPGRFLAVNQIKGFIAYLITTYDIKFEEGKSVPREFRLAGLRLPGKANLLFRTRQK